VQKKKKWAIRKQITLKRLKMQKIITQYFGLMTQFNIYRFLAKRQLGNYRLPPGRHRQACRGKMEQMMAVGWVAQLNHLGDNSILSLCFYYSCRRAAHLHQVTMVALKIADKMTYMLLYSYQTKQVWLRVVLYDDEKAKLIKT